MVSAMCSDKVSGSSVLISKGLVVGALGVIGISSLLSVFSLGLLLYKPVDVKVSVSDADIAKLESRIMHSVDKALVNYKQVQEAQLKSVLKTSEKNFGVYSKKYVEILVDGAADNLEKLMPKGSLSAIAEEKMKSFLKNEDLKNIQFAENHGVDVVSDDDSKNLEKLKKRLLNLMKNEDEVSN